MTTGNKEGIAMAASSWFAIRTVPGAQKPEREYAVERTRSAKGYRIVASLNPDVSAVERALSNNGFTHYMPAEKRLVRDRRHTDLWKPRRFALMVGYVFVHDPHDWRLLAETSGVQEIVRDVSGNPYPIDLLDILRVRTAEAEAEVIFDRQSLRARQDARKKARKDPRLQKLISQLDITGNITFSVEKDHQAA